MKMRNNLNNLLGLLGLLLITAKLIFSSWNIIEFTFLPATLFLVLLGSLMVFETNKIDVQLYLKLTGQDLFKGSQKEYAHRNGFIDREWITDHSFPTEEWVSGWQKPHAAAFSVDQDQIIHQTEKDIAGRSDEPAYAEHANYPTFHHNSGQGTSIRTMEIPIPISEIPMAVTGSPIRINSIQNLWDEKLQEFNYFFNHSRDLACLVDPNGTLELINPVFEKTIGLFKYEIIGQQFISFVHPDDIEMSLKEIENLVSGAQSLNIINRYRKKDGTYIWLDWNLSGEPKTGKIVAIARDISDLKKAEFEINQLHEKLEQKVMERTSQLEAAVQELETFTYSVSHDLRTPLRAIGSYAQMLEEDYLQALDEEGKRVLLTIRKSAEKMGTLIDDLLSFSRLGKQAIQKSPVDMNSCVLDLLDLLQHVYKHKAEIIIHTMPDAFCDRSLIRQVILNLLGNAIKYSSKNDHPVIELFATRKEQDIVFCIKDNGIGFDMKYAHKLFGVFQRLHGEKEFEGNGVGLAISERIINLHGGRIWAESIPGEGATFYFSLPVAV